MSREASCELDEMIPVSAEKYLGLLFGEMVEGEEFELRAVVREGLGYPAEARSVFFRDPNTAWAWVLQWKHKADIYVGVAPRRGRVGTAQGVSRLLCLWADADFKGRHFESSRYEQLKCLPCPPSMVVSSGQGFHAYWLLDKPAEGEEMQGCAAIMKRLAQRLEADDVSDLPRVLRLPGTYNQKRLAAGMPLPVRLVFYDEKRRYSLEQMREMAGVQEAAGGQVPAGTPLPTANRLLPPALLDVSQVLQGVPEGSRDITLFRLACKLRRAGVPLQVAARLVKEAAANCTPPFPEKQAVEKAVRAYSRYPDGTLEKEVMHLEERARMDPTLRALANSTNTLASLGASRGLQGQGHVQTPALASDLREINGNDLAAQGTEGQAAPPSLSLLGQGGYVIEGWSHVLAGYPRCGKTELLVRLCREWLDAGRKVIYFTEEPQSIWAYRLSRMRSAECGMRNNDEGRKTEDGGRTTEEGSQPGPSSFVVGRSSTPHSTFPIPHSEDWSSLQVVFALNAPLDRMFERAFGGPEEVVVIDTIRGLLQLVDETDNSRIAAVLNPWIAAARMACKTLVMAHHMRKGSGEYGEGIAGGHALLGVFDVALELQRDPRAERRRRIKAYARLVAPPELVYELEEGGSGSMRYLGDPSQLQLSEVVQNVREVLTGEWQKTLAIREALGDGGPSLSQVKHALRALAVQEVIERDPPMSEGEVSGRTVRWKLVLSPTT